MNTPFAQKPLILWSPPDELAEQDCACSDEGLSPAVLWAWPGDQAEDDCACPTEGFNRLPQISPTLRARHWQLVPDLYRAQLPGGYELVFNPLGPAGVVVLNEPARAILNSFAQRRPLADPTSQQLANLGLLQPQGEVQSPPGSHSETLTAWLHVTNACNLRCTYCYLAKTEAAMNEATGRAALEAIFRSAVRHGFQAVKLKYAGGEATLNFPLMRTLHKHADKLAGQTGLKLREVVLSNGVALGNDLLDFIYDTGMRLMISLDGVGATHDAQRVFANGRGSFSLVERGIDRALSWSIQPYLSVTVTGQNADGIADVVAFALDRGLLFNLNFYRDNDFSKNRAALQAEDERLIAGLQAAFAIIEVRLPQQSLIAALIDRASFSAPHQHTCGAGHNYLVIDQNGSVARCQMEIEHTITDIFEEDPLAAIQKKSSGFQNVSVDEKQACRDCTWRYWCAGGCPLLTYRVTGRSDIKSPYCNVYKALYPDMLRLEGLRLLKWHSPPH